MSKEKVTLKYISSLAGVSVSTVSRALNHDPRLNEKTTERILALAKRLNYVPNQSARNLKTGKSKTIGLLLPNIRTFMYRILNGVDSVCSSDGYNILLGISNNDMFKEMSELKLLLQKGVDGIILFHIPGEPDLDVIKIIQEHNCPLVIIDREIPGFDFPYVKSNNKLGSELLVNYLADNGHSSIAMVYDKEDSLAVKERITGFQEAIQEHHFPFDSDLLITTDSRKIENGYRSMEKIVQLKDKPSAIIGCNGDNLLGIAQYFSEHEELKTKYQVCGFNNLEYLDALNIRVTTLDLQYEIMAQKAASLLFKRIEQADIPLSSVILDPVIITR